MVRLFTSAHKYYIFKVENKDIIDSQRYTSNITKNVFINRNAQITFEENKFPKKR